MYSVDTGSFRCSQNSILFSEEKEEGSSSDWSTSDEDDDSDSAAIKTLFISRLTLHCRLSGSREPSESLSVTSGF